MDGETMDEIRGTRHGSSSAALRFGANPKDQIRVNIKNHPRRDARGVAPSRRARADRERAFARYPKRLMSRSDVHTRSHANAVTSPSPSRRPFSSSPFPFFLLNVRCRTIAPTPTGAAMRYGKFAATISFASRCAFYDARAYLRRFAAVRGGGACAVPNGLELPTFTCFRKVITSKVLAERTSWALARTVRIRNSRFRFKRVLLRSIVTISRSTPSGKSRTAACTTRLCCPRSSTT